MISPSIQFAYTIADDVLICDRIDTPTYNAFDFTSVGEIPALVALHRTGKKRLASDGLMGAIIDGAPTDATIVLLQEFNGMLVEVGRVQSPDGSYLFEHLKDYPTHIVAMKEGYNAGIVANVVPVE